jgi:uncharacterized protein YjaZ
MVPRRVEALIEHRQPREKDVAMHDTIADALAAAEHAVRADRSAHELRHIAHEFRICFSAAESSGDLLRIVEGLLPEGLPERDVSEKWTRADEATYVKRLIQRLDRLAARRRARH